jgi:hypothetical protein
MAESSAEAETTEQKWQWAQRRAQEWQGVEATATASTTSRGRRKVFLLDPWDQRLPPHASLPFGNQEEDGVGS